MKYIKCWNWTLFSFLLCFCLLWYNFRCGFKNLFTSDFHLFTSCIELSSKLQLLSWYFSTVEQHAQCRIHNSFSYCITHFPCFCIIHLKTYLVRQVFSVLWEASVKLISQKYILKLSISICFHCCFPNLSHHSYPLDSCQRSQWVYLIPLFSNALHCLHGVQRELDQFTLLLVNCQGLSY